MSVIDDEDVPFEEESDVDEDMAVEEEDIQEDDAKLTDRSLNLAITNMKFIDRRKKRKNYRRIGKSPPDQVNVKITVKSYELVRGLAYAEGLRHSPFYEEYEFILEQFVLTRQKLQEKEDFLLLAQSEERRIREERNALRSKLDMLAITKLNDSGVSLEADFNERNR